MIHTAPPNLTPAPGTYLLLLTLEHAQSVTVGRLGRLAFTAGSYAYVGSAHGPGGLRARVGRHLRATKTLHWHIDYLTTRAMVTAIWYRADSERLECRWARTLGALDGVIEAAAGFGASDCGCRAHLFSLPVGVQPAAHAALGSPATFVPPR